MRAPLGHTVVAHVSGGREAIERAKEVKPDVVLLDIHMPEGSGLEAAEEIRRTVPAAAVVLFSGDQTVSLTEHDITATSAIAFENRKTIERAKGILMRRTGTSEAEAYRILQRTSQDRSVPMVEIARAVLDSEPTAAPAPPREK